MTLGSGPQLLIASQPAVSATVAGAADVLVNNNNGSTGTGQFTQSETSIVAFGNNIVVGFNDAGSFGSGNRFTGWSYSSDGGATFTDGGILPAHPIGDAGDPVMARDNITGRIYFSTLGFNSPGTIQMWRSDDNGVSWMAPVNATPGGSSEDKQWHAVDNFAGPGNGNVYLLTRRFSSGGGIYFYRSTDGGATFGPNGGTLIVSGLQGAYIAVGTDHSVYAFWWAGSTIQMRRSTDQGLTFGPAVTVATGLVGGTNGNLGLTGIRQGTSTAAPFRSNSFPHAAVNPVNGHLYVTYNNDAVGTDKADVFMVTSTNNGATWSAPVRVNDDATTTDQFFPTVAVSTNGTKVGIFYYSRQEDAANNNLFKYYGRIGTVTGGTVSFDPSFAISDVASFPEFGRDNVVNSVYMGDYNQAVATPGKFHVVWSDNRDDLSGGDTRKDPNVYYEAIPICDVPQVISCNIQSILANNTYTGGGSNTIFLGYGPQSTTLQATVNPNGNYTYQWSGNGTLSDNTIANPVFTPTAAGTYNFTLVVTSTDGCASTTTCDITICVVDVRVPGTNGQKVYLCHAASNDLSKAKTLSINVGSVADHLLNHPGDRLGSCEQVSCANNASLNSITGRQRAPEQQVQLDAYPNPSTGTLNLQFGNIKPGRTEIRIFNSMGRLVEKRIVEVRNAGQSIELNLNRQAAGIYNIQVISNTGVQTKRVLIRR